MKPFSSRTQCASTIFSNKWYALLETRTGPFTTCPKKRQKSGLLLRSKTQQQARKTNGFDSAEASCKEKRKLKMVYKSVVSLYTVHNRCCCHTESIPDGTQAEPNKNLPSESVYTAPYTTLRAQLHIHTWPTTFHEHHFRLHLPDPPHEQPPASLKQGFRSAIARTLFISGGSPKKTAEWLKAPTGEEAPFPTSALQGGVVHLDEAPLNPTLI